MKTIPIYLLLLIAGFLFILACEPEEKISEIPQVGFKNLDGPYLVEQGSITLYGAELIFEFRDGNSDFGVDVGTQTDTLNLFINPFQKVNSSYDSIDADLYGRKYSIKRDEKLDRDGAIKGEIKVLITYLIPPPFDTVRYEFYIVDRAGNISNTGVTTDFAW